MKRDSVVTIVAISDMHYFGLSRPVSRQENVRGELGRTLLKKVFLRLAHQGIKPDVAVILGDLLDNGTDPNGELDLITIHGELTRCGIPCIVLPGNHDGDPSAFNARFGTPPGLYRIKDLGFVVMGTAYAENYRPSTPVEDLARLKQIRKENPDLPLIALQHAPAYPVIDTLFPYRIANAAQVMDAYRNCAVSLALSGHYHTGTAIRLHDTTRYHTVPALCEAPFRFSVIRIEGDRIEIDEQSLALPSGALMDSHCHTEHAFCGTTVDTAPVIATAKAMGIGTLCLTEHAFQLYFEKHEAMGFRWQSETERVERAWAAPGRGRMAAYRRFAEKLRSPFVKIGLEVDLYGDGELLIAPEDRAFPWDILVGAIHKIKDYRPGVTTQREAEALFLRDVEQITGTDIHVLAHPFRWFDRHHLQRPKHLYGAVSDLLAENGVAVEVNYHTYSPDPEFVRLCVAKGIPVALASDTHDLAEAGEFWPHLHLLKQAGITSKNMHDVLFKLPKS